MTDLPRLVIAAVVLVLLARACVGAWRNRHVALAVWRRIRPRHVAGSIGLLLLVVTVLVGLTSWLPFTRFGLGSLFGLTGNAVFAPLEQVAARPSAADGLGLAQIVFVASFLILLLALFPWLAYVEERLFREGLEQAGLGRELFAALRFGLAHLVMLIPLAAALAVAVAGFAYGRIYRAAYRRAALARRVVPNAFGLPVAVPPDRSQARSEAVLASTVWHTTFNSLIVVVLLAAFLLS